MELIDEIHGIKIVEDSKSTSAQSLAAALHSHGNSKNILLIAGGSDKGDDFSELGSLFARRVKKVACIGATKKLFSDLAKQNNIEFAGSLFEDGCLTDMQIAYWITHLRTLTENTEQ